jgi:hypothetical protein
MMTQEKAVNNLHKWFWKFKHKLVDDFPEYHKTFDYIVANSDENSVLYEVMEFANIYLEEKKGGLSDLTVIDYLEALEYGYNEWVK